MIANPSLSPAITDCALLVLSCDPYADLWPPFFGLLHRHWADCPFPILLGAGKTSEAPTGVRLLRSDGGRDWSKCTQDYLDSIEQPYVLIMLDDFFLRRTVSTKAILQCLKFARSRNVTQLRLIPRPGPTDKLLGEINIGSCAMGSPYRLCAQAAIWDRSKLRNLLRAGESIWEFEKNGNDRVAMQPDGFFSVRRSVLPYDGFLAHHVVEKGKWLPHEKRIFARAGINCDFSKRGSLSWKQTAFYHLVQLTNRLISSLPWRIQLRVRSALKSILRPFLKNALNRLSQTPAGSQFLK